MANHRWCFTRDELVLTMQWIYRHRATTASGGNPSMPDRNGGMWSTPTAVDPFEYDPGMMTIGEKDLRNRLCEFIESGYQQGLLTTTTGTFPHRHQRCVVSL